MFPPGMAASMPSSQGTFSSTCQATRQRSMLETLGCSRGAYSIESALALGRSCFRWMDSWRASRPPSSGASNENKLVYGFYSLTGFEKNPFAGVMPEILHISEDSSPLLASAKQLIELILDEQIAGITGWQATVNRLVQVLFLNAVRAHLASLTRASGQTNWLHGAMDPTIGPAIGRMHSEPEKPWTVNSLAKETNLGKSAFSERFRQIVGEPPLQYLTGCRMQQACELLIESDLGVKEVASRVGYESASSFSNAFKRLIGTSPADFRASSRRE